MDHELLSPTGKYSVSVASFNRYDTNHSEGRKKAFGNIMYHAPDPEYVDNALQLSNTNKDDESSFNRAIRQIDKKLKQRDECLEAIRKLYPGNGAGASEPSVASMTISLFENLLNEITVEMVEQVKSDQYASLDAAAALAEELKQQQIKSKKKKSDPSYQSGNAGESSSSSAEVPCKVCNRSVHVSRFAPHLEKCMGMGRSRSKRGVNNGHSFNSNGSFNEYKRSKVTNIPPPVQASSAAIQASHQLISTNEVEEEEEEILLDSSFNPFGNQALNFEEEELEDDDQEEDEVDNSYQEEEEEEEETLFSSRNNLTLFEGANNKRKKPKHQ